MPFAPGQSGNPNGRPPGARSKTDRSIIARAVERGDKLGYDILSKIANDPNNSVEIQLQAAAQKAQFEMGKCGARPPLRFNEEPVSVPPPTTIAQARENIIFLSDLKAQGRLDIDTADGLIADQYRAASIMIDEAKLAATGQGENQNIQITGGLPDLIGTNIIMPQRPSLTNGHQILEPPEPRILPKQDPDTAPAIPPDDPTSS